MPLEKIIRGVKSIIDNPKTSTATPKAQKASGPPKVRNQYKAEAAGKALGVPGINTVRKARDRTENEMKKRGL